MAIVISGGPDSVYATNVIKCDPNLFDLDIHILGIYYGLQLMNSTQTVLLTRGDSIDKLASNFCVIASSPNAISAIQHTGIF